MQFFPRKIEPDVRASVGGAAFLEAFLDQGAQKPIVPSAQKLCYAIGRKSGRLEPAMAFQHWGLSALFK